MVPVEAMASGRPSLPLAGRRDRDRCGLPLSIFFAEQTAGPFRLRCRLANINEFRDRKAHETIRSGSISQEDARAYRRPAGRKAEHALIAPAASTTSMPTALKQRGTYQSPIATRPQSQGTSGGRSRTLLYQY